MSRAALPTGQILVGDVRAMLDRLPADSVDCVVTSPPYFRLRNYGKHRQIGLETHVDDWVNELRLVARGLKRVLKPSGALWLNLGDTYSKHEQDGARNKSLVLAPERLALALVKDGWVLRNKVIWAKSNPMPTSVRDRLSCTWEVVCFFTRDERYHFDLDAIRIPHRSARSGPSRRHHSSRPQWSVPPEWRGPSSGSNSGLDSLKARGLAGHPLGKNPGDVWTIPTAGYRGAHHAVYPTTLVERPILATCPPGGVVLDPFIGSGTTAIAAEKHGRHWIGIELNPEFAALAQQRIAAERAKRSLTTGDSESLAA
jgi:DNA modification methylase